MHDGSGGIHKFRVERVFIALLDKLRADILQQLRVCQFRGQLRLPCFLFLLEIGDVAGKATRVNEFSVFEQSARIYQDMADRSVAMPQTRRMVAQRFAPAQASEDVVNDSLVGVKLGNIAADILFARIPEKIKLRLIRPEDCSVFAHPVKRRSSRFPRNRAARPRCDARHEVLEAGCCRQRRQPPFGGRGAGSISLGIICVELMRLPLVGWVGRA